MGTLARERLRRLLRRAAREHDPQRQDGRLALKTDGGTSVTIRVDDPAEGLLMLQTVDFPALERLAGHPAEVRLIAGRWLASTLVDGHLADYVWNPITSAWQQL